MMVKRKKMVILASYLPGESYGLLGPQAAATVIQEHSPYTCMVIAVTREDDKRLLKRHLADFFGPERPLIAFSYLSGREDLYRFAGELKEEGALTILAGPQADMDYCGEKSWQENPARFQGLSSFFSFALHGPAEQILPFLNHGDERGLETMAGVLHKTRENRIVQNAPSDWNAVFLKNVSWENFYRLGQGGFMPQRISTGQVLWHIGCPHAAREARVEIDFPSFLGGKEKGKVVISLRGCSFCDVAVDKGFHGSLGEETVLHQILGLPRMGDGRTIPFELINENALPGLPRLLHAVRARNIPVSRINLTLRADGFVLGQAYLREALGIAREMGVRVHLGSMGFESFDASILSNLHKGLDVATNLRAVQLMREMKEEFPEHWGYSRQEGALHGLIHPTPWDSPQTEENNQEIIRRFGLAFDILPEHSIPLIIHHASPLGDWIREVEGRQSILFKREGTIIGWWQVGDRFVL